MGKYVYILESMQNKIFLRSIIVLLLSSGLFLYNSILTEEFDKERKLPPLNKMTWSKPVNISKSTLYSWAPIVSANNNGKAYVVWVEEVNKINGEKVYFNTNENGEWGKSLNISGNLPRREEGAIPSIFVDNKGAAHIVFSAISGTYEIFYNKYHKGKMSGNVNISQTSYGGSTYQSIAIDNNGFIYVVWQDDENAPPGSPGWWEILMRYKDPNKTYWSDIKVVPPGIHGAYTPDISIDGFGGAHLVWIKRAFNNSVVWYSFNPNPTMENKWISPIAVSYKTSVDFCWPKVASDNNGNAYVVWEDNSTGNREIFFRKKINGVWETIENISQTSGISIRPAIAVEKSTGNIYVVWQEKVGDWEIFFRAFQNGQWSEPINLTNNSSQSIYPNIWVDNSGGIHVVYADNSEGSYNIMYISSDVIPEVYPPINISLETKLDYTKTKKINVLSWEENPENEDLTIVGYKIYRKEMKQAEDKYKLIASVDGTTFKYEDKDLPTIKKFTYVLTSVAKGGYESEASEEVIEEKVFPPINIKLESVINSSLFSDEKINILKWEKNPLNDPVTVVKYNIYRKGMNEDLKLLLSVEANVFEYKDRFLPLNEKFSYALTSIDNEGNESKKSELINEK